MRKELKVVDNSIYTSKFIIRDSVGNILDFELFFKPWGTSCDKEFSSRKDAEKCIIDLQNDFDDTEYEILEK